MKIFRTKTVSRRTKIVENKLEIQEKKCEVNLCKNEEWIVEMRNYQGSDEKVKTSKYFASCYSMPEKDMLEEC